MMTHNNRVFDFLIIMIIYQIWGVFFFDNHDYILYRGIKFFDKHDYILYMGFCF